MLKLNLIVYLEIYRYNVMEVDFMYIGRLVLFIAGMALILFGYFIYFQKRYNLINGFEMKNKLSSKDIEYAKKVGLAEFIIGIVLVIVGIILCFIK